jgi:O-antigen/teichoic acid export membrane protein
MINSHLLRKAGDFALYRVVNLLFPFFIILFFSNKINSEELGLFFLAQGLAIWVSLFIDFGMIRHGVVLMMKNEVNCLANILFLQVFLSVLVIPCVLLVSTFFNKLNYYDVSFIILFGAFNSIIPKWYFQAKGKMIQLTKIEVIVKLVVIITLLLPIKVSDRSFVEALLILSSFTVMCISWAYVENFGLKNVKLNEIKLLLSESKTIFFSRLFGNMSLNANIIVIGIFLTPSQIATYGVAEKIIKMLVSIVTSVGEALYPLVAKTFDQSVYHFSKLLVVIISVIMISVTCMLAPFFAEKLFNYERANSYLIYIMSLSIIFYGLSSVVALFRLVSNGLYKQELYSQVLIGSISLIFSFVIINQFGVEGAASAYLLSSIISFVVISIISAKSSRN